MTEQPDTSQTLQELANTLADSAIAEQHDSAARRVSATPGVARQRGVRMALAVAVPILIAVLVVNYAWGPLMSLFETAPPLPIARQQAQEMLKGVVADIESFHKDYGALPPTLVAIGVPPHGRWSYTVLDHGQYRVDGRLYGQTVSFDSTTVATKPSTGRP